MSGLYFIGAVAFALGSATGQGADKTPADPWEAYRAYLGATRGGDVSPYLTDEGLAQWRAFSPEAKGAATSFLYSLVGLRDAKRLGIKTEANRVEIDAILYVDATGGAARVPEEVKAHVELMRGTRGWGVRSETFTPPTEFWSQQLRQAGWTSGDSKTWTGLRAPGIFPPSVQQKVDAKARDRVEGDEWALADVRSVISAEAAYSSANNGYYDRLECLAAPAKCIPAYPQPGPSFIDQRLAAPRNGYRPRFDGGPKGDAGPQGSRSSILSYAYWMIPDAGRAGRVICGDATGVVCVMTKAPPPSAGGACPAAPECAPLH